MKIASQSKSICSKIENLKTALFSNTSPAVMRLASNIITVSAVESQRTIWFQIKRPCRDISGLEPSFFAQLQFYNRKFDYFIRVEGKATIFEAEEHNASGIHSSPYKLWIKLDMLKTYYYHYNNKKGNFISTVSDAFYSLTGLLNGYRFTLQYHQVGC
jgi:hypothetical protein